MFRSGVQPRSGDHDILQRADPPAGGYHKSSFYIIAFIKSLCYD